MLKKKSIKKKITSLFIAMSSITLIFVSGISIGFVTLISKSTTDSTSTSLRNQIENNMLMTAEESSRVIMKKLQRVIAYLEGIISSIKQLFGAEVQFNATTSYFDYNLSTLPPDAIFNPIYNDYISNSTSTYYIPNSNPSNIDSLRTISMNASINKSAHVDSLLSSIFNENQGIAWIRIAFEDGHILRRFPGTTVDPFRTYDPLTSVWYLQAKASLQEAVIYSNPFQDTTNFGWLLSISKSIYVNDTFIGVASIDLKLQTIQNDILTMTFLDTGYSALIQPDGTILAHPEWDFNGSIRNINDLEIHSNQTPAINLAMIQNTGFLTSGLLEFMKDDDKYILSYAPVNEQYYFISIVKELEAIKSVELIRQDSMHIQSIVLFGTIMLSLLVFVIVLTCGVMTATKITEPIDELSKIAKKITKNVTNEDIFDGINYEEMKSSNDEIGTLVSSFTKMCNSLQIQNRSDSNIVDKDEFQEDHGVIKYMEAKDLKRCPACGEDVSGVLQKKKTRISPCFCEFCGFEL